MPLLVATQCARPALLGRWPHIPLPSRARGAFARRFLLPEQGLRVFCAGLGLAPLTARAHRNTRGRGIASAAAADHYGLLGLQRQADTQEIQVAYSRAVSLAQETKASELLPRLEEAYAVLSSRESREQYDRQLQVDQAWDEAVQLPEMPVRGPLGKESNHRPGRAKVFLKTFGCQHNQSDGEYMLGQLHDYGYTLVDKLEESDICVVNSCTVKTPSESRGLHLVNQATELQKQVVLAGCVPSGDKRLPKKLPHVSMLHVTQLDRIVDVVEETSKGRVVTLLDKKKEGLPSLALPKVRQDRLTEIITINAGCLNFCTYCKTRIARGTVVSYSVEEIVERALQATREGVCHIELASEDMGAYGVDIGSNIAELLLRLSDALPAGVMLRTGMTNPPYIMEHLDGVIEALKRPNVYSFMHIPVQSGSDAVLKAMKRKYTVKDFLHLVGRLREEIPDIYLLTDIICGFPTETEKDWKDTLELVRDCRFHGVYSSRYFARAGTPAAKLQQLPHTVTKRRYQELCALDALNDRNAGLQGTTQRVWFAGTDGLRNQTVGRTKNFAKVLVPRDDSLLGQSAMVEVLQTSVQHVEGRVVQTEAP
ncbi:cdkal1 [Symbiodinium sp. CCMP2592]|nr:cdkal1 [Symbiodinium sp. CCMP2592]